MGKGKFGPIVNYGHRVDRRASNLVWSFGVMSVESGRGLVTSSGHAPWRQKWEVGGHKQLYLKNGSTDRLLTRQGP